MAPAEALRVEVAYCPRPGVADVSALTLPPGATLADALRASGVLARHGLAEADVKDTPLRDRDRVELYRPLTVDPKEARRQRYRRHKQAKAAPAAPG
jgi:putative ubiquitin-RnfH superfamily antitoxin RatB of RatAB toxin-antitoxin module